MKQGTATTRFVRALLTLVLTALLVGGTAFADGDGEKYAKEAAEQYHKAQKALDKNEYEEAAKQYEHLIQSYGESKYVSDALYWRAFALYRMGDGDDLKEASRLLIRLQDDHPEASSFADAEELYIRILGERGSRGDVKALEALTSSVYFLGDDLEGITVLSEEIAHQVSERQRVAMSERTRERMELIPQREFVNMMRFESSHPDVHVLPHIMISGRDDDDDLRITALNALIQMDSDRALPVVRGVLDKRDEGSAELRRRALFILAQSDSDEAGKILLEVVREDPDPEVRAEAVFWLGEVPGDESLNAIKLVLDDSRDGEVQEKAIHALARHDSPKARLILQEAAADKGMRTELRVQAIFWLGHDDDDEGVEFLKGLYKNLPSKEMKEAIISSVARHESRDSQKWLMKLVRDEKEDTESRAQALFWAGQMDLIPAKDLNELYKKLDSQEMKEQLIFVLSHQDDEPSRDLLVKIAKEEKSIELRKQAIFWLGQTDDPRVIDILEEIINEK